jgi:hypothetical protein
MSIPHYTPSRGPNFPSVGPAEWRRTLEGAKGTQNDVSRQIANRFAEARRAGAEDGDLIIAMIRLRARQEDAA